MIENIKIKKKAKESYILKTCHKIARDKWILRLKKNSQDFCQNLSLFEILGVEFNLW